MNDTDKKGSLEEYLALRQEEMEHRNIPGYWTGNPRRWLRLKYTNKEPLTPTMRIAVTCYIILALMIMVGIPFIGASLKTDIALVLALIVGPPAMYLGFLSAKFIVKVRNDLVTLKEHKVKQENEGQEDGT